MPNSSQLDSLELTELTLPYDPENKIINDSPRLVAGSSNVYVDRRGVIRKTGGLVDMSKGITSRRIDRLIEYDAQNGRKYLVASVYNPAGPSWGVYYLRLDGASSWTAITNLRNVNNSEYPHEMVAARGVVFIKSFPGASGDKLGSVIFDGRSTPATRFWGLLGPTTPARRSGATSTWTASTTNHTVLVGWTYVYTWVTSTGHESSRSPLEYDPAQQPSNTGAFTNKRPTMVVQGHADTTNVPYINIYRTTDGGGTFLYIDQITNTGAGSINYNDTNRTSAPGDPKTDAQLDTNRPAPSVTSNSPPPTVEEGVIGTATVERSSPIAYWNGRLWYGVGRNLYFSGNDEIRAGRLEEAWPSGVGGNSIQLRGAVRNLEPTQESLIVHTADETLEIRGSARNDIRGEGLLSTVGSCSYRTAAIPFENAALWMDQRFRLRMMEGGNARIISDSLGSTVVNALDAETTLSLEIYQAQRIDWIVLALHDLGTPANSRWWILDLARLGQGQLWSPPWTKDTTAICVASDESEETFLYAATYSGGNAGLAYYSDSTYADLGSGFAFNAETNLFSIPDGNHVHRLAKPRLMPNVLELKVGYVGNAPTVKRGLDSAGAMTELTIYNDPPRATAVDAGYVIRHYGVQSVAQRVRMGVSRTADSNPFELESFAVVWDPTQGD